MLNKKNLNIKFHIINILQIIFYLKLFSMKNLNILRVILGLFSLITIQSCVSTSALQTARVTPVGETAWGLGLLLIKDELINVDSSDFNDIAVEISTRYGITDKLDIGSKFTLFGTGSIDVKYQFLGNAESKIAASTGVGFGYLTHGSDTDKNSIFDVSIPAYFSCHPVTALSAYVSPRFIYRLLKGPNNTFFGGAAGLRFGTKKIGIFTEYVYLNSSKKEINSNQTQFNIGIGINFK